MNSAIKDKEFSNQYEGATPEDLKNDYKKLDPKGDFFRRKGIRWSTQLGQAVRTEIFCNTIPMEGLLGDRGENVPPIDPDYVPLYDHVKKMAVGLAIGCNIALSGPPGSSKTSIIEQICARTNRPFFVADMHEEFRPELLKGHVILTKEGSTQFVEGPLTKAMGTEGSVFLADEANLAGPGILAAMHRPLAGYEIYLEEDGYRKVSREKGVIMAIACNALNDPDSAHLHSGVQQMNHAFLDRFGATIRTGYPEPLVEEDIVWKSIYRKYSHVLAAPDRQTKVKDVVSKMIKAANDIRGKILDGGIDSTFSIRRTITWGQAYVQTNDLQLATQLSVLDIQESSDALDMETSIKSAFGKEYQSTITGDSSKNDDTRSQSTV